MNMQQLNLDWIMERVAHSVPVVELPAPVTEDQDGIDAVIEYNMIQIPNGPVVIVMGNDATPATKRVCCWVFKIDDDNMFSIEYTFLDGIGMDYRIKYQGTWGSL